MLLSTITAAALAALGAVVLTPLVRMVARRTGALDHPIHRKSVSRRVVPRLGGLAIFFACWASLIVTAEWHQGLAGALATSGPTVAVFLGGAVMLFLGTRDDYRGLPAAPKFLAELIVATTLVLGFEDLAFTQIAVPYLADIPLGPLAIPLSIAWIIGVTNALNVIDGADGLAAGTTLIIAAALAAVAVEAGDAPLALTAAALAGACLGFLPYNFGRASIFMGDSGSLAAGLSLAVLAMATDNARPAGSSLVIPLVLLGYPILDLALVMARRLCAGKSMFEGDQRHIHHHLLALKLSHPRAVALLYMLSVLFGLVGVTWALDDRPLSLMALALLAIVMAIGAKSLRYFHLLSAERIVRLRHERPVYRRLAKRARLAGRQLRSADSTQRLCQVIGTIAEDFDIYSLELLIGSPPDAVGQMARTIVITGPDAKTSRVRANMISARVAFVHPALTFNVVAWPRDFSRQLKLERQSKFMDLVDVFVEQWVRIEQAAPVVASRPRRATIPVRAAPAATAT